MYGQNYGPPFDPEAMSDTISDVIDPEALTALIGAIMTPNYNYNTGGFQLRQPQ